MKAAIFLITILMTASSIDAGLLAYGICQTGCNAMAVACYGAGGATFGTGTNNFILRNFVQNFLHQCIFVVTAGAGVPAVIIGCNAALGNESLTSVLQNLKQ